MPRGRGYSTPRGYRGSSSRGNSSWNGSSNHGGYSGSNRYNSFSDMDSRSPYDSRSRYSSSDRFSRSEDYHKSYRPDYGSMGRDRRSPDRKRMRMDAPSSRHDSYYGSSSRHDPPSYSDRRGLSSERHSASMFSRREEFRRPSGPPKRGNYRGRISSRGSRGLRGRDRPIRRRLLEGSYAIRRRIIPRISDYSRKLKISRMRSAIIASRGIKRGPKSKEGSSDEKEKEDEEGKVKDEDEEVKGKEKTEEDKEAKSDDEEKKKRRGFIKLHCPHCNVKVLTFRRYELHLISRNHLLAMRKVALKQKAILGQMRKAQRNTQNELEKSEDDLTTRTSFCPLCKLNYKQKRAVHQLSESHKNMKKFLMPYCKVCNVSFKSPMIYENHCCSIDHMKRKQRMETSDGSAEEDNLENFTTIDSVGDVDGEGAEEKKDDDKEPAVDVGIEKIRKIETYYCDLCKMYLQRGEEPEMASILTRHCKQRVHVNRYTRLKEKEELEKRAAEKLQKKEADKLSKVTKSEKDGEEAMETDDKEKKTDDEETKDDKLWADVDKDLGDILAEAESGNKSSDEDDDSHVNGERYDRFKLSEKNGEEKLMGPDEEGILDNKLVINDAVEEKK